MNNNQKHQYINFRKELLSYHMNLPLTNKNHKANIPYIPGIYTVMERIIKSSDKESFLNSFTKDYKEFPIMVEGLKNHLKQNILAVQSSVNIDQDTLLASALIGSLPVMDIIINPIAADIFWFHGKYCFSYYLSDEMYKWKNSLIPLFLKVISSNKSEDFLFTLMQTNPLFYEKLSDFIIWFFDVVTNVIIDPQLIVKSYTFDLALAIQLQIYYSLYGFKFDDKIMSIFTEVRTQPVTNSIDIENSTLYRFFQDFYLKNRTKK